MSTSELIDQWILDVEALTGLAEKNAGELTEEQLNWKPDKKAWGVGQCIEHLVITGTLYNERIAAAIKPAQQKGERKPGSWRPSVAGKLLIGAVRPGSRKVPAAKVFKSGPAPRPNVVGAFVDVQKDLRRLMNESREIDLSKTKLTSPASRLIRLNLGDAFTVLVVHAERHIQQAIRVRWANEFPAGEGT